MGKMSRNKGKVGERELAGYLKEYGYDCRRGQQFSGKNGDAPCVSRSVPWAVRSRSDSGRTIHFMI